MQSHRAVAERCGYKIVNKFVDSDISNAKDGADTPSINKMMKVAIERKFNLIMVWSIDRLGRSLQNLLELLNEMQPMIDRLDLSSVAYGYKHLK